MGCNIMNDLKYLVGRLDGLSIENLGFRVLEASNDKCLWHLKVQGYYKKLDDHTSEDTVSTLSLVEKIEDRYGSNRLKWKVLKVEVMEDNMYNLTVIKCWEDNKNEENHNSEGKQVEAEK